MNRSVFVVTASCVALSLIACRAPRKAQSKRIDGSTLRQPMPSITPAPAAPSAAVSAPRTEQASVRQRVHTQKVSGVTFRGATGDYREVLKLVRTVTDIPIIVTPQARAVIDEEALQLDMDIVAPLSVANLLDLMVQRSDRLGWLVRNGVVEFTSKEKAQGSLTLFTHDVRDLLFAQTEFLPPRIAGLPTGDESGESARIGGEADEKVSVIEPDVLVDNVKLGTDPSYWDAEGGGSIEPVEGGYLIVRANPRMQRQVARFLDGLR